MSLKIKPYFDQASCTWSYIVADTHSKIAAIIDPVLDFDLFSGAYDYQSANLLIKYIKNNSLTLKWIIETHAHADHLTAADYLKTQLGGQTVAASAITQVQSHFSESFNLDIPVDGSQFDRLLNDREILSLGNYQFTAYATPGHTKDSMAFKIEDNIFIGDTLFHPYTGTARCDFPGGSVDELYQSLQFLLSFPEQTRLWLCHDYPEQRIEKADTTVAEQKNNKHLLLAKNDKSAFCQLRMLRDQKLAKPKLLYPSIQVNIRAGQLPQPEANGSNFLKIPLSRQK